MVDASHQEESCSSSTLSVAIDSSGKICGLVKEGVTGLPLDRYVLGLEVNNL